MRIVPLNALQAAARCNASARRLPPLWLLSLGLAAASAQAQEASVPVAEAPLAAEAPSPRLQGRRPLQRLWRPKPLSRRRLPKYQLP
ncbi:hypothetical protein ACYPJF_09285 [Stenotrophomonas geniculata]